MKEINAKTGRIIWKCNQCKKRISDNETIDWIASNDKSYLIWLHDKCQLRNSLLRDAIDQAYDV